MNIEVKSITPAQMTDPISWPYEAELFLNGKPAAYISFNGREEGPRLIPRTAEDTDLMAAAEQYCKQQAASVKSTSKTVATEIKQSLSLTVDAILQEHLQTVNRQLQATLIDIRSSHSILYGNTKTGVYGMHTLPQSVDSYLETDPGEKRLIEILKTEVAPKLRANDSILNPNLSLRVILKAFSEDRKQKPARNRITQGPGQQRGKH